MTDKFKELYDTLTLIRDFHERSDTLISRALELAFEVEYAYKLVEAENDELSGKYNGCVIERNIALRKLDSKVRELDKAYAQIGKAYMIEVDENEKNIK